jgi:hypothetical protein
MHSASSAQNSPAPQTAPIDASGPGGPTSQQVLSDLFGRFEQLQGDINFLEQECRKMVFEKQQGTGTFNMTEVIAAITKAIGEKKVRAKVPTPTEYDGSKDKLPIFFKEMKVWLEDNSVMRDDEKIRLTLAFLKKGEAAEWSTQQVEDGTLWRTYKELLKAIRLRFGDLDLKYTARQKLMKVRQTGSVEAYNTEFRKYAKKTGFSNEDLSDKYTRGLSTDILRSIYLSGALPTSLEVWISQALHFDRLSEQLHELRPAARNTNADKARAYEPRTQPVMPPVRAESDYKPGTTGPMDIDTARRENKCRFCRQPWEFNHVCEKKRLAQKAYEQRAGKQRKEIKTETDLGGMIAALKDELDIVRKELKEVKDEGN